MFELCRQLVDIRNIAKTCCQCHGIITGFSIVMLLALMKITLMDAYISPYGSYLCYYGILLYYMHLCYIYVTGSEFGVWN